jgi:hypothetical protein
MRPQAENRPEQQPAFFGLQLPQPQDGSQQSPHEPQPQLASQPQLDSQQSPHPQDDSQHSGPVQPHIGRYDSQPQL